MVDDRGPKIVIFLQIQDGGGRHLRIYFAPHLRCCITFGAQKDIGHARVNGVQKLHS